MADNLLSNLRKISKEEEKVRYLEKKRDSWLVKVSPQTVAQNIIIGRD